MRTLEQAMETVILLRPFSNNMDLFEVSNEVAQVVLDDLVVLANEVYRLRAFIDSLNTMTAQYSDTKRKINERD